MKTPLLLTLFLSFGLCVAQAQTGLEIMKKMDLESKALAESSFSVMSLTTCKFGKKQNRIRCIEQPRVKKMESAQLGTGAGKLDSKSISILLLPNSEKGIGMLSYSYDDPTKDTQSWLYLSALGKVKRMASGSDDEAEPTSVFGSEFTTEDMETGKVEEYSYRILKTTTFKKRPVWIIESVPNAERLKKTRYAKTILWVDQERYLALKIQTFDKRGKAYKQLAFSKVEQVTGHWMARSIVIINQQTNRLTKMSMEKIAPGVKIDEDFLSQRSLTDFAFREKHLDQLRKQMH